MRGVPSAKLLSEKSSSWEKRLHLTFKSSKGLTLIDSCFLLYGKHFPCGSQNRLDGTLRIICKMLLDLYSAVRRGEDCSGNMRDRSFLVRTSLFFLTLCCSAESLIEHFHSSCTGLYRYIVGAWCFFCFFSMATPVRCTVSNAECKQ